MADRKDINIITLGCSKNLVDSEFFARQAQSSGFRVRHESEKPAAITVINTCGFIHDAKEQSVETILHWIDQRNRGNTEKVFVTGCLSQRYRDELLAELPEVDGIFGVDFMKDLLDYLHAPYHSEHAYERYLGTPAHYAYLKISEGCNRRCSFCAIPAIRGNNVSRTVESLVQEAELLVRGGVRELMLIAQDLTYYGLDLYGKRSLDRLIDELVKISGLDWIRLHYAYPVSFPVSVLHRMAASEKVCNYMDIPLQHINSDILRSMRRHSDERQIRKLISTFRKIVPDIAIRTSFIVGYPGETRREFEQLLNFVKETQFDRVGVFTYSHEEETSAARLQESVSERVKRNRLEKIMEVQQDISLAKNRARIGTELKVIADRVENGSVTGRTQFDSPEVDNEVHVITGALSVRSGEFLQVKITGADIYDLSGTAIRKY